MTSDYWPVRSDRSPQHSYGAMDPLAHAPLALTRAECLAFLATAQVGRLGVSLNGLPSILPVNYLLTRERIIIRTISGSMLDAAVDQLVVAFQVDDFAYDGSWGWSVLVQGLPAEITDAGELTMVEALPLRPWVPDPSVVHRFLTIETTLMSGRQFGSVPHHSLWVVPS